MSLETRVIEALMNDDPVEVELVLNQMGAQRLHKFIGLCLISAGMARQTILDLDSSGPGGVG